MVDRYTKVVLTIIAAALVGVVVQNAVGSLGAQTQAVQRVAICNANDPNLCAEVFRFLPDKAPVLLTMQAQFR